MAKAKRSFVGTSAAIFRVEEQVEQEASMTQAAGRAYGLCSGLNKRFRIAMEITLTPTLPSDSVLSMFSSVFKMFLSTS
jgi:hypothetical protein